MADKKVIWGKTAHAGVRGVKWANAKVSPIPLYNRPHKFHTSDSILVTRCTVCAREKEDTIHCLGRKELSDDEVWKRNAESEYLLS